MKEPFTPYRATKLVIILLNVKTFLIFEKNIPNAGLFERKNQPGTEYH